MIPATVETMHENRNALILKLIIILLNNWKYLNVLDFLKYILVQVQTSMTENLK